MGTTKERNIIRRNKLILPPLPQIVKRIELDLETVYLNFRSKTFPVRQIENKWLNSLCSMSNTARATLDPESLHWITLFELNIAKGISGDWYRQNQLR